MINISQSSTLSKYKTTLKEMTRLLYPNIDESDLDYAVDWSINKNYQEHQVVIDNNYTHSNTTVSLLDLVDYINERQPIITASGTMFARHGEKPNPLAKVIAGFLADRAKHKNMMFENPKGSELYERYNLMQSLT